MIIKDIIKIIDVWCPSNHPCKSDEIIYGSENADVHKVCVCCIATCDVIRKAKEWGADLIITHEPTYHIFGQKKELDLVNLKKVKLIEDAGINIYRIHDHMHFTNSDKIIEGVLKKLDWEGEFDGNKKFSLKASKSISEIKSEIEKNLNLKNVRLTGDDTQNVKNISMCVGSWGTATVLSELEKDDIDVVICGEISEWQVCEYVRDASQLGFKMSLLLLGHMGSERSGMEYLCEYLKNEIPELEFNYLDCEEVY